MARVFCLLALAGTASAFVPHTPAPLKAAPLTSAVGRKVTSLPVTPRAPLVQTPTPASSNTALKAVEDWDKVAGQEDNTAFRRLFFLLSWVGFLGYAWFAAPGGDEASIARDAALINDLASGTANPIVAGVFNLLALVPTFFNQILLPGSRDQRPPTLPFALAALGFGIFGIGPYLAFREFKPYNALPRNQLLARLAESKILAAGFLTASILVIGNIVYGVAANPDALGDFANLFQHSKLVHVATLNIIALGITGAEPIREDMKRRDWYTVDKLLGFNTLPAIAPCLYLLLRPSLDTRGGQDDRRA